MTQPILSMGFREILLLRKPGFVALDKAENLWYNTHRSPEEQEVTPRGKIIESVPKVTGGGSCSPGGDGNRELEERRKPGG